MLNFKRRTNHDRGSTLNIFQPEWHNWLVNSGIDKSDIIQNSSTVLEVLQQYENIREGHTPSKSVADDPVLPKVEMQLSLKEICSDSSNKDLYEDLDKIGEGSVVFWCWLWLYLTSDLVPLVRCLLLPVRPERNK